MWEDRAAAISAFATGGREGVDVFWSTRVVVGQLVRFTLDVVVVACGDAPVGGALSVCGGSDAISVLGGVVVVVGSRGGAGLVELSGVGVTVGVGTVVVVGLGVGAGIGVGLGVESGVGVMEDLLD